MCALLPLSIITWLPLLFHHIMYLSFLPLSILLFLLLDGNAILNENLKIIAKNKARIGGGTKKREVGGVVDEEVRMKGIRRGGWGMEEMNGREMEER